MKNQNKKCKRCSNNKFSNSNKARNRTILKSNIKEELIYNRRNKKFKYMITDARYIRRNQALLDEFVIYSILNTGIDMKLGVAASLIARSVLALYNQLVANRAKNPYINEWQNSGENIIVLRGYHHKHLKYLEKETQFVALDKHVMCHRWLDNHIMMVLSLFGRREDFEDIFDKLCVW